MCGGCTVVHVGPSDGLRRYSMHSWFFYINFIKKLLYSFIFSIRNAQVNGGEADTGEIDLNYKN
jgi:hypothetical protein